jgi:hypothetical protein
MGRAATAYSRDDQKRRRAERFVLAGIFVIIASIILWQAVDYWGLVGWLAELQFALLKTYYPPVTFLILLALICSPLAVYRVITRMRSDKKSRSPETRRWRAATRAARLMRLFAWLAAGCALTAIVGLVMISDLPRDDGVVNHILVGSPAAASPALGKTELEGDIGSKATAALYAQVPKLATATYFAPVFAARTSGPSVQYFVEMHRVSNTKAEFEATRVGVLARNALPGEIMAVYRGAGYVVQKPYYVLYASAQSMRMPYYIFALEFGAAAMLFVVFSFIQRWHRNAIRRALARDAAAAA